MEGAIRNLVSASLLRDKLLHPLTRTDEDVVAVIQQNIRRYLACHLTHFDFPVLVLRVRLTLPKTGSLRRSGFGGCLSWHFLSPIHTFLLCRRIVNPVFKLLGRQKISKILFIAGDKDELIA